MSETVEPLPGMPEPWTLQRVVADGEVIILRGPHVFAQYEESDRGMRNLAVVALRDAGFSLKEVATCFSLTPQYVSMLRGRAKKDGSAGLVRQWGRGPSLSPAKWATALQLSDEGKTDVEIGKRFGVHSGTVGRQLARLRAGRVSGEQQTLTSNEEDDSALDEPEQGEEVDGEEESDAPLSSSPLPRLAAATVPSRYAGSMLLHPFLSRLGIDEVLASLPPGAARRYDATALLCSSTFGFALGISSLEGAKHLRVAEAGALVGLARFPHLRTLRPRLKDLADHCDPLAIQRGFARAMVAADEAPPELYFVDDHFVTYWGGRPVQKGYNVRRHLAEPGRDDTFVVDDSWRAICFSSGEPRGLSVTMAEVTGQLQEITGGAKVMVGFDRGGSYPKVFTALAEENMEWVTWRRAPLAPTSVQPRPYVVTRDGEEHTLLLADEMVTLSGYDKGPVRQLSAYEDGKVVFQILTSDTAAPPGALVAKLRARWCIENFNKYAEDHYGAHWLCTYKMTTEPNTALRANPARTSARKAANAAQAAVAEAERSLGQAMDAPYGTVEERLAVIRRRRDDVAVAKDALLLVNDVLKGIPAKLPANEIDPQATRAKPHLATRALQMVCRLLAYNAELDLARRFNAYLGDSDEYRTLTRNLLHLGGTITYERKRILVHLDRPDAPRIARALGLLVDELNRGPEAHIPGDRRPITYEIATS